jgi:hypothetical protein
MPQEYDSKPMTVATCSNHAQLEHERPVTRHA